MANAEVCTIREYEHPKDFVRRNEILAQFDMVNPRRDTLEQMERIAAMDPESTLMMDVGRLAIGTLTFEYYNRLGTLSAVAVDRAYQGLGYGSMLIREGERRLAQRGCQLSEVLVDSHKKGVIDFYKRLGYGDSFDCVGLGKVLSPESPVHYSQDSLLARRAIERVVGKHARRGNHQLPYSFKDINSLYASIQTSDMPDMPRIGSLPGWLQRYNEDALRPTPWVWVSQYECYQRWIPVPTYSEDLLLRTDIVDEAHRNSEKCTVLTPSGWYVSYNYESKRAQVFGLDENPRGPGSYRLESDPNATVSVLKDLIDQARVLDTMR